MAELKVRRTSLLLLAYLKFIFDQHLFFEFSAPISFSLAAASFLCSLVHYRISVKNLVATKNFELWTLWMVR